MVEYCDTLETERWEQTGNTKHTYTLEASSLLDPGKGAYERECSKTFRPATNATLISGTVFWTRRTRL
jgi:hypothetical protein